MSNIANQTITSARFVLDTAGCLAPTPAGAYYAVQAPADDPARRFLLGLLAQAQTGPLTPGQLAQVNNDTDVALQMFYHLQAMGYLQVLDAPEVGLSGPLEEILPPLLAKVADSGKAILADEQGFYLSLSGFPHEAAEELSALSANLFAMQERHRKLLQNNLGLASSAWGIIDAAGNSDLGFWPLFFPRNRFTLVLSGMPRFNCREFTTLIRCLAMRYSN